MKKRTVMGLYAWSNLGCFPLNSSGRVMKFPRDFPIFCPLMVIMLLCTQ